MNKLSTLLLLALGLAGCHRSEVEPDAALPAAFSRGQVVRYDLTYDAQGQNPRLRWIVQLAAPMRVRGWNGRDFTQVKVFSLADTLTFRRGVKFNFTYHLVPQEQQTAWATHYERAAILDFPAGYVPNPELALANVQVK